MGLHEDLKNCRIVIRDVETGRTIADTTILTYDEQSDMIRVSTKGIFLEKGMKISVLIFSKSGLFENQGTVGEREQEDTLITLYEGVARNDRHAVRYRVNIQGQVDRITRPAVGKIDELFDITVLNMSSIGLLIQAPAGKIREKDVIRFSAVSKGQRLVITAEAMRVAGAENEMENIGCSIQLVNLG
ncbi:MAG: hypothetical protein IJ716_12490 [Lachnospiraceae bacterium]|nr:hypothetical protein [Lachnospiraceae bacterium]